MKRKKIFSNREEAEKYNNYLLISGDAGGKPYIDSFHTKKQAEKYAMEHGIYNFGIYTRKKWSKYNENN